MQKWKINNNDPEFIILCMEIERKKIEKTAEYESVRLKESRFSKLKIVKKKQVVIVMESKFG